MTKKWEKKEVRIAKVPTSAYVHGDYFIFKVKSRWRVGKDKGDGKANLYNEWKSLKMAKWDVEHREAINNDIRFHGQPD